MAAPTPTARGTPTGVKMLEGFHIKHTFASDPTFAFFEAAVKLPGFDGGEPIPQDTQFNTKYKIARPGTLIKVGPVTYKAQFSGPSISQALAMVNVETTCTDTLPDGTTICYYGNLQKVDFEEMEAGKAPMADVTVNVTNWDYTNNVEAGPVITPVAGS